VFEIDAETQRQFDQNAAEFQGRMTALLARVEAGQRKVAERVKAELAECVAIGREFTAEIEGLDAPPPPVAAPEDDIPASADYYGEPDDDPPPRRATRPRAPSRPRQPPADDEDFSARDWLE
jgi:hypothetical protein